MARGSNRENRVARIKRTRQQQSAERSRCQEAAIRTRRIEKRGEPNRRVLDTFRVGDHEVYLHATKGWKWRRVDPQAIA